MPTLDAKLILAVLGAGFLLLAAAQRGRDGRLRPSGKTWLRIGLIFAGIASWLWWRAFATGT